MESFVLVVLYLSAIPWVAASSAQPLLLPPSQYFEGNDGSWSSYVLSIGGPRKSQTVRVFPSTSLYQIWTVSPDGCPKNWIGGQGTCEEQRGGFFNNSLSGSWTENSKYRTANMAIMQADGYDQVNLNLGWDRVEFSLPNSGGKVLNNTIVGEMADYNFSTFGLLGLDPKPSNFSDKAAFSGPQTSMLQMLKNSEVIPSLSFGYTAGEASLSDPVFGSLVLGGYDSSRFDNKSGGEFAFSPDVETPIKLTLSSVEIMTKKSGLRSLRKSVNSLDTETLPSYNLHNSIKPPGLYTVSPKDLPIQIRVDSTRPFIYLPRNLVTVIADEFGLAYDSTGQWLLINDTNVQTLKSSGSALNFAFSGAKGQDAPLNIQVPMASLVQPLGYPYSQGKMSYVPLRASDNRDQYVLGRAFLQRAYLKADYERKKFGLYSTVSVSSNTEAQLVPITPLQNIDASKAEDTTPSTPSHKLTTVVLAGIVTGCVAFTAVLMAAIWFCCRRRKKQTLHAQQRADLKEFETASPEDPGTLISSSTLSPDMDGNQKLHELDSAIVHESSGISMFPHSTYNSELSDSLSSPVVGELDSASTAFGGFYKEIKGPDGDKPIIKVYYEMDTSFADETPSSTISNPTALITNVDTSKTPNATNDFSPIPQTPAEYYDRIAMKNPPTSVPAVRQPVPQMPPRVGDCTSVAQAPLEYYPGGASSGIPDQGPWIGRLPRNMPTARGDVEYVEHLEEVSEVSDNHVPPGTAVTTDEVPTKATTKPGLEVNTTLPKVTLTPATPLSPTRREVERSRWLRGHSGRRKGTDKNKEQDDDEETYSTR